MTKDELINELSVLDTETIDDIVERVKIIKNTGFDANICEYIKDQYLKSKQTNPMDEYKAYVKEMTKTIAIFFHNTSKDVIQNIFNTTSINKIFEDNGPDKVYEMCMSYILDFYKDKYNDKEEI